MMSNESKRNVNIDIVRIVAAFFVVCNHSTASTMVNTLGVETFRFIPSMIFSFFLLF